MWIVEADGWSQDGRKIVAPEQLALVREALERSPVIVEHWFYRGSSAPDRLVFDDLEDFQDHLANKTRPGDLFYVWEFAAVCNDDNRIASGKYPDDQGRVPEGGPY